MSTKCETLRDPLSCLNKAHPDEPVFVLRANDPIAAQTIRLWAAMAFGVHEEAKIGGAIEAAAQLEHWRESHVAEATESNARTPQAASGAPSLLLRNGVFTDSFPDLNKRDR